MMTFLDRILIVLRENFMLKSSPLRTDKFSDIAIWAHLKALIINLIGIIVHEIEFRLPIVWVGIVALGLLEQTTFVGVLNQGVVDTRRDTTQNSLLRRGASYGFVLCLWRSHDLFATTILTFSWHCLSTILTTSNMIVHGAIPLQILATVDLIWLNFNIEFPSLKALIRAGIFAAVCLVGI